MGITAPDREHFAELLLRRRLEVTLAGTALGMIPSLAAVLVTFAAFVGHVPVAIIAGWTVTAFLVAGARLVLNRRIDPASSDSADLRLQWQRIGTHHIIGSIVWAAVLPIAALYATGIRATVLLMVGTAVLMGGTLLMRSAAPKAAQFHIVSNAAGLAAAAWIVAGPQAWTLLALVAIIALALLGAARLQEKALLAGMEAETQRLESESTVRLLLNEYEAQAADWLWTVGPDNALTDVSDRFAEVLGSAPAALNGTDMLSLFEPGAESDRIAGFITARSAFRDEPVPVRIDGVTRFWRLSGRPGSDGGMTGVGRDVTEQREIEVRVRTMAYVDPLTGLANRHLFNQRLREAMGEDGEEARPVALLYLDLDDFKAVNDTQGHIFGDGLLREMGARLRAVARDGDLVARLGGDEFAVLVEAPGGDGLLIERAHSLLEAAREPFLIEGLSVRISTSVGIARRTAGCDAAELMRRVDLALYAAKAKGRDQLAIFDEALDRRAHERRALEIDLRDALARNEMVLHYQPIISLASGETVGYEALLRWQHPERGLMMPERFLSIAEDTGLIIALGDWVIRTALADIAEWPGNFRLALNLSPSQTRHRQLIGTVEEALAASGVAAGRLEFEITEHVLLQDAVAGAATLDRLRALGAEIALDDFGTGYSSLSYLRRFRFDRVKIDRTFVRDLETSDEARAIVSAITRIAEALGMRTTAEGVERPEQLDLLRKLGCDEAQGFLILKPVEASLIETGGTSGDDRPGLSAEIEGYREARRASAARAVPRSV